MTGVLGPHAVELERGEALAYLASVPVVRVVQARADLALVTPVNAVLLPDGLYLRTSSDSAIAAAADRQDCVTVEADAFDARARNGWSVLVRGRASCSDLSPDALADRGLDPWPGGPLDRVVRISGDLVDGRRVGSPAALSSPPR